VGFGQLLTKVVATSHFMRQRPAGVRDRLVQRAQNRRTQLADVTIGKKSIMVVTQYWSIGESADRIAVYAKTVSLTFFISSILARANPVSCAGLVLHRSC
jgi:hypothetical protein